MSHFFAQDLFANWAMIESLEPLISFLQICIQNYGLKAQFLTKIKMLHERYDLSPQGKFWLAITQHHIH